MSLLRVNGFFPDVDYPAILKELAASLKGIDDPLVAVYAGCYLTAYGQELAPLSLYVLQVAECSILGYSSQKVL
jgi:hypothetical protein